MFFKTLCTSFCLASFFLHSTSSEVLFGSTFNLDRNERLEKVNIEFMKGDNPIHFSEQISSELALDEPSRKWFIETFAHSLARLDEKEVLSLKLELPNSKDRVTVREGDDISQLAHVISYLNGLTVKDTNTIYESLVSKVPQHSSKEWKDRKKAGISRILTKLKVDESQASSSDECQLTLGLDISTSSGEDVTDFIESFPPTNLLCEVVVVGKHSDVGTKKQLLNSYPHFSYFFKSNRETRTSKEVVDTLGTARFVLFIEDTKALAEETDSLVSQGLDFLKTEQGKGQEVILQFATKEEAFTLPSVLFSRS